MAQSATVQVRYLLGDGLGPVRQGVDEAGEVVAYQAFDPYGKPVSQSPKWVSSGSVQKPENISSNRPAGMVGRVGRQQVAPAMHISEARCLAYPLFQFPPQGADQRLEQGTGLSPVECQLVGRLHQVDQRNQLVGRLGQTLAHSPCAPLFLTPLQFGDAMSSDNYPSGFALPHYATVRLLIQKERWLHRRRDVRGYRARVLVLKNKLGAAGRSGTIAITFNGVVRGDST